MVFSGRNAYAMSVLRRVEMKLNGLDNVDNRYLLLTWSNLDKLYAGLLTLAYFLTDRELSIAEQVDYLLKQATSVDNLCNMYEGWTPWI